MDALRVLWRWRKYVVMFATPILLSFMPIIWRRQDVYCAYVLIWVAVYWMLEIFPIPVTGLMPLLLLPMFGILTAEEVAKNYCKDTAILFIGGMTIAIAIEHVNLHRRIALRILLLVGSQPQWLMLGFMGITFVLSMWISNTATTAMMIPIVVAVLDQLMATSIGEQVQSDSGSSLRREECIPLATKPGSNIGQSEATTQKTMQHVKYSVNEPNVVDYNVAESNTIKSEAIANTTESQRGVIEYPGLIIPRGLTQGVENETLCKGMLLSICYAANIGGSATLTGTGTNMVLAGQINVLYDSPVAQLTFSKWLTFAFPICLISGIVAWIWLQFHFLGVRNLCSCFIGKSKNASVHQVVQKEYENLGPVKFKEIIVLCNFFFLVFLWLFREPNFFAGWGALFESGYITDATAAIFAALVLFIWPAEVPSWMFCKSADEGEIHSPIKTIMTWEKVSEKLPWNVILLIGGGFALAEGVQKSGLAESISDAMTVLDVLPPWLVLLIITMALATLTEFTTNAATASIYIPIVAELAGALCIHPFYFLYSSAIACSFAFMLPIATPPNAIVFSYGVVRIIDMVKAGIVMNILSIITLSIMVNIYGYFVFGFGQFPDWGSLNNATSICTG